MEVAFSQSAAGLDCFSAPQAQPGLHQISETDITCQHKQNKLRWTILPTNGKTSRSRGVTPQITYSSGLKPSRRQSVDKTVQLRASHASCSIWKPTAMLGMFVMNTATMQWLQRAQSVISAFSCHTDRAGQS